MTILCEPDEKAAVGILPSLDGLARTVDSLALAATTIAADPTEDLVVIGRTVPLDHVLSFSTHLQRERPGAAVLLLRDELVHDDVLAAEGAGVREVVRSDDPDLLSAAYRRARGPVAAVPPAESSGPAVPQFEDGGPAPHEWTTTTLVEPPPPAGRIATVFSAKGGSGKTTIATNLAVALHAGGQRRVCLVDLDLEFGDVAISLQLSPVRSLVDAVTDDVERDEDDALRALVTEYRPGLDCILAPIEPGAADKIPADIVADLLVLLRARYDYVVVDTPSQFSEHVLAALDASDFHVLLSNPEIPSMKNLRLTLDMLDLLGYRHEARSIVFNRADDAAGLSTADIDGAVRAPIAARVPASRDVPASINRGVPIVAAKPDHPVSTAIRRFALDSIVGEQRDRRRSLLGRVFRRRSA